MPSHAQKIIGQLDLMPHPEGGFYKPTYTSEATLPSSQGERKLYTNIYFLLRSHDISHLHRLQSDEFWYFHAGKSLTVHMIHEDGVYEEVKIGLDIENGEVPQFKVPKHTIFGSSVNHEDAYALVSCMVSPGFEFEDFELFTQDDLIQKYPSHKEIIQKLAYKTLP